MTKYSKHLYTIYMNSQILKTASSTCLHTICGSAYMETGKSPLKLSTLSTHTFTSSSTNTINSYLRSTKNSKMKPVRYVSVKTYSTLSDRSLEKRIQKSIRKLVSMLNYRYLLTSYGNNTKNCFRKN